MNTERKFLAALARAHRLRAEAFRAEAEAARLNPWTPAHHNRTRAEQCEASAAHYLDMADETEGEMA